MITKSLGAGLVLVAALGLGVLMAGCGSAGTDLGAAPQGAGGSGTPVDSGNATSGSTVVGAPGPSGSGTDATAACNDWAAASCHKLALCDAWVIESQFEDEAACQKRLVAVGGCVSSFALRGTSRTVARLEACTAALNRATCSAWRDNDETALAPCRAVPGALADGVACGVGAQCQSAHCRFSGDCGVCGPAPVAGDTCSNDDRCAPGLNCRNGLCVQPQTAGASCEDNLDCLASLVCSGAHCVQPRSAGQACTSNTCDAYAGLRCVDGVCRSSEYVAPGRSCDEANGVSCALGGFCRQTSSSSPGTCLVAAKDGGACDLSKGPHCLRGATCTGGFCKVPDASACR